MWNFLFMMIDVYDGRLIEYMQQKHHNLVQVAATTANTLNKIKNNKKYTTTKTLVAPLFFHAVVNVLILCVGFCFFPLLNPKPLGYAWIPEKIQRTHKNAQPSVKSALALGFFSSEFHCSSNKTIFLLLLIGRGGFFFFGYPFNYSDYFLSHLHTILISIVFYLTLSLSFAPLLLVPGKHFIYVV